MAAASIAPEASRSIGERTGERLIERSTAAGPLMVGSTTATRGTRAAGLALLLLLAVAPYLSYLAPGTLHRGLLLHGGCLLLTLAVGLAAPRRPVSGEDSVAASWRSVDNPAQEQRPRTSARP